MVGFRVRLLGRCYDGHMPEMWRLLRAVSRYWAILLTGSALAGLMIGLEHYLGASLSWGIFLAFGGGLVLVFFLIWRDEHRARLEVEQKLFVPATLQAAIGRLVVLKEQGDHHLSATVRTEEDFQQWTSQETAWREEVVDWLYEEFSPVDRSLFEHPDPGAALSFPHPYNEEHNGYLTKLHQRLQILQHIIARSRPL